MVSQLNKNKPKVSIGMPVYNGERYICAALDSLLAQTFTDFELIISDNCSIDKTEAICLNYAKQDNRVRYSRNEQNIGALGNFLKVLNLANGELFMWAACDDFWDKKWIENLANTIQDKQYTAAYGNVMPVNNGLQVIPHIAINQNFEFTGSRLYRKCKYFLDYEGRGKGNLFYALYPRKILKEEVLKNTLHFDYSIIFNLLSFVQYKSCNGVSTYKRIHSESADQSSKADRSLLSMLRRFFFPLPFDLFLEYLKSCNTLEKLVIIMLLPIKVLVAYYWKLKVLLTPRKL